MKKPEDVMKKSASWLFIGFVLAITIPAYGWSLNYIMEDLGAPSGVNSWSSLGNNSGQIVVEALNDLKYSKTYSWQNYQFLDIGSIDTYKSMIPYAINNRGQIVGTAEDQDIDPKVSCKTCSTAFLWSDEKLSDIGSLTGLSNSKAVDINELGQILIDGNDKDGNSMALIYSESEVVTLENSTELSWIKSAAINNLGQVAGDLGEYRMSISHGFFWQDGKMVDIGSLEGGIDQTSVYDLNDTGQIVGLSGSHAFLWANNSMKDLGTLDGGNFSLAYDINNAGQVVGYSTTATGEKHAFLWEKSYMIDLGTLGGANSVAYAINDAGLVVGVSEISPGIQHAFALQDGKMTDLGSLGESSAAYFVTENGIVGGKSNLETGEYRATLWTLLPPPPPPEKEVKRISIILDGITGDLPNANGLSVSIDAIFVQLDKENYKAACNILQALANKVQALTRSGNISAMDAEEIITAINQVSFCK